MTLRMFILYKNSQGIHTIICSNIQRFTALDRRSPFIAETVRWAALFSRLNAVDKAFSGSTISILHGRYI